MMNRVPWAGAVGAKGLKGLSLVMILSNRKYNIKPLKYSQIDLSSWIKSISSLHYRTKVLHWDLARPRAKYDQSNMQNVQKDLQPSFSVEPAS